MINNDSLKEQAKKLPQVPGVYLMKDSLGNIIYIGKSKSLRNRVIQYFYNLSNRTSKIEKLVLNIHNFDHIITDTELDALLLECNLIKKIKPSYNSLMKNNSRYCYIKINLNDEYGVPEVVLEKEEEDSYYFGPYSSPNLVKETLGNIFEVIPFIRCSKSPLIRKRCHGVSFYPCRIVCEGSLKKEEYKEKVIKLKELLNKENNEFIKNLEKDMEAEALTLNFERAKIIRDSIKNLEAVMSLQGIINLAEGMKNIVVISKIDERFLKLFCIKGNKILYMEKIESGEFYKNIRGASIKIKSVFSISNVEEVNLTKEDIDEANIIYSYIKNKDNDLFFIMLDDKIIKNTKAIEGEINRSIKLRK